MLRRSFATAAARVGGGSAATAAQQLPRRPPGTPVLNLDEALYVASEAGYTTRREVQLQIVRSPPFSPAERPFMLENFFQVPGDAGAADESLLVEDETPAEGSVDSAEVAAATAVPEEIHGTILRHFSPEAAPTFWHNGREWRSRAEGRGTRKRAAAHALLVRGSGQIKVNGEEDIYSRWPFIYNRFDVVQPFKLTGTTCAFDVFLDVQGGGISGQSGAARLAIARALLAANPACHDDLQRGFCLLEDTRQKLPHQPGKKGRRTAHRWNQR